MAISRMTIHYTGAGTFPARHALSRHNAQHPAVGQRVRIRFYLGHLSGDHDDWVDGTQEPLLTGASFTAEQEERTRRASGLRPVKRGMGRYSLSSLLRCRHWGVTLPFGQDRGRGCVSCQRKQKPKRHRSINSSINGSGSHGSPQ